jgi:isopropylmalate/homocitrate/citramalate synthase
MILGKHTGKAALAEKLKERQIDLSDPLLAELLRRVKLSGEARNKETLRRFLDEYRGLFEHPGISDAEFWNMVDQLTQARSAA